MIAVHEDTEIFHDPATEDAAQEGHHFLQEGHLVTHDRVRVHVGESRVVAEGCWLVAVPWGGVGGG